MLRARTPTLAPTSVARLPSSTTFEGGANSGRKFVLNGRELYPSDFTKMRMKVEQQKFSVFSPLTYADALNGAMTQLQAGDVLERSKRLVKSDRERRLMRRERGFQSLRTGTDDFRPQETPALFIVPRPGDVRLIPPYSLYMRKAALPHRSVMRRISRATLSRRLSHRHAERCVTTAHRLGFQRSERIAAQ